MDKIDSLNQTADIHRLFNHPILDKPSIPNKKRCDLRVELISEELKELKEAIETNDIVEIADALCDIYLPFSTYWLLFCFIFVNLYYNIEAYNRYIYIYIIRTVNLSYMTLSKIRRIKFGICKNVLK